MSASNPQNDRAARHLALPQIGEAGQRSIESATVLVIGMGGLGCAVTSYLASSGIGHLLLCDFDTVDASNLGRQILYGPGDIGRLKCSAAAARLSAINPDIRITEIPERLSRDALIEAVSLADVVVDGCDNFATRFQVNDACVEQGRTLISGAAIRFEGQLAVFGPDYKESPCYRCLYEEADESLDNCAGQGVFAPLPGTIGTLMAAAALKEISGLTGESCRLSLFDGLSGEWRDVAIAKNPGCPTCGE